MQARDYVRGNGAVKDAGTTADAQRLHVDGKPPSTWAIRLVGCDFWPVALSPFSRWRVLHSQSHSNLTPCICACPDPHGLAAGREPGLA